MDQDLSAKEDEDKESVGKVSSPFFAFLDELQQTDTVVYTTKPSEEGVSTLKPASTYLCASQQLRIQEC